MRAINSGTASTLVQITRSGIVSFAFAENSKLSNVFVVCPWGLPNSSTNQVSFGPIATSALYKTYAQIYDEVRLERMEVYLAPARSVVSGSNTLMLYSAIDRKFTGRDGVQTVSALTQASGVVVKNIQPATTVPFKRVVYPRDLQEKITFIDSTAGNNYLQCWAEADTNFSAFSPGISYGLLSTVATTSAAALPFVMTVKYYVRFRNPKTEIVSTTDPVVNAQDVPIAGSNLNTAHDDVLVEGGSVAF